MKKTIRKILFSNIICIFALTLVLALCNISTVFASSETNYVAQVNSVKYENYADAWDAVSNGGTITMLDDWTISSELVVDDEKSITIHMNGFMINRGLNDATSDGEVFWVKSNATLNVIGEKNSTTEHKGTIQSDVWHYNANGNYVIEGALITGGYSSNGGGAIHIKNEAQVTITNVTIAGNVSSDGDGAGAIRLDSADCKLTITDSEICYNKATDGGGAIGIEGVDANVQIFGTKINNNIVTDSGCNGGAIQINEGTVTISKSSNRVSEISFNTTTRNGGGIYISNGNLILDGSTILARNTANKEGGAVYVDSGADNVEISGNFVGNKAKEEGGAVYVNSDVDGNKGVKISDAEFLGNSSVLHGGAIYVDSDNNISLSGKVIVNGNTPNNLYILDEEAIVSNALMEGSRVGIKTSWDANNSSPIKTTNYQYFVSDTQGYEIAGGNNSVYYVETEVGVPENLKFGNDTYPITKGTFVYNAVKAGQVPAYYYYSDAYFADSAKYYNEHLVTMSANVAIAAVTAEHEWIYTEAAGSKNVADLFISAGFSNLKIHYPKPEFFGKDSEILSTIGYVIASRETVINGKNVTIIAIAVRGGAYAAEWASNVVIGDGVGEARSFNDAANQVEKAIYEYIKEQKLDTSKSKFWISGFSRGGATTNLVAKRLTDNYGEDNVYAYCFETPKGGVFSELKDGFHYANIHCVINPTDLVPNIGTTEMGFIRYGVDHMLPSYRVGSGEYGEQKEKMLEQLAATNPLAVFDDEFHEATILYVWSSITGSSMIDKLTFPNYKTAAEWNPYFTKKLQEYSLTNNVNDSIYNKDSINWHGYRNYWSTYKWYLYEENNQLLIKCYDTKPSDYNTEKYTVLTIEDSLAYILNFYFGTEGLKKELIMKSLDLNAIKEKLNLSDIYWDIIGEWNDFSIEEKNEQFNKIWSAIEIEQQLKGVLTVEELANLKKSFYVLADFLLDFVGDDYDKTDQDLLGTLVYNISRIMQTHHYEILCAWTRSYDSFYASGDLVAPPLPPRTNVENGTYNSSIKIDFFSDSEDMIIYYTLDGSIPNVNGDNCFVYQNPLYYEAMNGEVKIITIKAITVYRGMASEVATFNYVVNTNAEIVVSDDVIHTYNFDGTAYLILAEYDDEILQDVEYFEVTNNSSIALSESTLNFNNRVVAYLVRDLTSFNPLCDALCLTDPKTQRENIPVGVQNVGRIETFEAKQADNPDFINITFTTYLSDATECFVVALFEKNSKSDFNKVLHFDLVKKNENNSYSFTVKRSRAQEALNGATVNNCTFVLTISLNGITFTDEMEIVYTEKVYTITYYLYGGVNSSENPDVFTVSSETIWLDEPKRREHYTFEGWYTNPNYVVRVYAIENGTSHDLYLYAKWQAHTYIVGYNDGVADEEVFKDKYFEAKYNEKTPSFGANPTREGYTFIGWDKEISPKVTGDVIYTAVWEKSHVHSPVLMEGVDADCLTAGHESYYECRDCGYYEDEACTIVIADLEVWKQTDGKNQAKGHDYEEIVTAPDCVNGGYTTYTCLVCGDTYTADETDALGHTAGEVVVENNVLPDCTNAGSYDNVVYCTVCEAEISRDTVIVEALGHTWEEATAEKPKTCKICGVTEGEKLPAAGDIRLNFFEALLLFLKTLWRGLSELLKNLV